ncbi:MAG: hypothetical protein ACC662_02115 [Planctomycetota bacterium]
MSSTPPLHPRFPLLLAALTLLAPLGLAACGRGEFTRTITDVREHPAGPGAGEEPEKPEWAYMVPEGWTLLPPRPLRDLGFRVANDPQAECTFTVLPGTGGGMAANVNRWRRQLGLEPATDEEIEALEKQGFLGLPARRVDLTGTYGGMRGDQGLENARLLGLIAVLPKNALFLKMVGPADVVEAERAHFDAFAASLKPKPHARPTTPSGRGQPPSEGPAPAGPGRPPALRWDVPEGWEERPARPMREVTLAPKGSKGTEAYVAILRGDAGGMAANINRWRGQMGQPPLSSAEIAALLRLEVLGREGVLVQIEGEFRGQGGEQAEGAALLGFVLLRDEDAVFVKMTGPADEVRTEKANFETFCRSLSQ